MCGTIQYNGVLLGRKCASVAENGDQQVHLHSMMVNHAVAEETGGFIEMLKSYVGMIVGGNYCTVIVMMNG